jgi:hypothetical protein
MATLEELNADLLVVNNAIKQLIAGERVTRFRISSGTSISEYQFTEVTMEVLQKERVRILADIAAIEGSTPSFRSARMQITYSKL